MFYYLAVKSYLLDDEVLRAHPKYLGRFKLYDFDGLSSAPP